MLSKLSIKQKANFNYAYPFNCSYFISCKTICDFYLSAKNLKSHDVVVLSTKIGALVHETQKKEE